MGIPNLIDCTNVGVYGPVASGKTWLLKKWSESIQRLLVIDSTVEWDDSDLEIIAGSPRALSESLARDVERFRIAYIPNSVANGFGWSVELFWQLESVRWLVLEEVHEYMNPWQKHPHMEPLLRYARKRNLGVIGSSQRLASVHKDFCANSRMSILFHTSEARDHDAIAERWGEDALRAVLGLRPLIWNDSTKVLLQSPECLCITRDGKTIHKLW